MSAKKANSQSIEGNKKTQSYRIDFPEDLLSSLKMMSTLTKKDFSEIVVMSCRDFVKANYIEGQADKVFKSAIAD